MECVIRQWGNSAAIRIPAIILQACKLKINDSVVLSEQDGTLTISPAKSKSALLDEMLTKVTPDNLHAEVDSGETVGKEFW